MRRQKNVIETLLVKVGVKKAKKDRKNKNYSMLVDTFIARLESQ